MELLYGLIVQFVSTLLVICLIALIAQRAFRPSPRRPME